MIDKTIQRIASGDTRALDKLYKELKPAFVAFFREHFNMDADAVQDLYQETIAAVYNNIMTGRLKKDSLGSTKLSTYVTQVGKYIHMSHLRKRQPDLTFETDKVMALGESLPDEEDASKEDKLFIVRRTVEDMPYPCSKILNLFYFLQKSGKEIAKIMDYSNPDVVKTQIYKCKQKLREQIVKRFKLAGYDEFE